MPKAAAIPAVNDVNVDRTGYDPVSQQLPSARGVYRLSGYCPRPEAGGSLDF